MIKVHEALVKYQKKYPHDRKRRYSFFERYFTAKSLREYQERPEFFDEFCEWPIRTFLISWGMMGRVLRRRPNWEARVLDLLKEKATTLERYRKLKLEQAKLDEIRPGVEDVYRELRKCWALRQLARCYI